MKYIAAESSGGVLVAGETHSMDFPLTPNALQLTHGGVGPFANWSISRISATGTLLYSTYYGGSGSDSLGGMAEDSAGNIWLLGATTSTDFPLLPNSLRLGTNALVKLDSSGRRALVTQLLPAGSADRALAPDSTGAPIILGTGGTTLRLTAQGAVGSQVLGIANAAATRVSQAMSPGEIMSLYGTGLASGDPVAATLGADGKLPTALNGFSLDISGRAASILYVSPTQVNFIVPLELDVSTNYQPVFVQGNTFSNSFTVAGKLAQPQIALVLNQDFTVNSRTNPAEIGSTAILYVFGGGAYQGNPPEGTIAGNMLWAPVLNVASGLGKVSYAGSAPGLALGVMQVNVQLTDVQRLLYITERLQIGYETSNSVDIYLK